MRFSLRWLFLVMAYVAIVVGAIASGSIILSDIVWTTTAVVFCYAAIMSRFATRRHQAMAFGFVLLAGARFGVVYLASTRTPAARLFQRMGYGVSSGGQLYVRNTPPLVSIIRLDKVRSDRSLVGSEVVVSTANATATMLAGLIGCGIGALAYRHSQHDQ